MYMPEDVYTQILVLVRQLTPDEQIRLIEELLALIRDRLGPSKPQHSILELEGLGKELWRSIDVDQYPEEERNSWDE
jgi:hypothetical protein